MEHYKVLINKMQSKSTFVVGHNDLDVEGVYCFNQNYSKSFLSPQKLNEFWGKFICCWEPAFKKEAN